MNNKRLYRSSRDKKIFGVCAGIAEYFNIDPTVVRLIYAVVSVFTSGFPGLLLYLILAFIMPEDDGTIDTTAQNRNDENN